MQVKENEVLRAQQLREIVTSLGPAYIKLGQALAIRPDILSPAAMTELQKLCDKVRVRLWEGGALVSLSGREWRRWSQVCTPASDGGHSPWREERVKAVVYLPKPADATVRVW